MKISNRDRFPEVEWLADALVKVVGTVEGLNLVHLGTERGTEDPIVAKAYTDEFASEDLFATPLSALLNHSFGEVKIDSF